MHWRVHNSYVVRILQEYFSNIHDDDQRIAGTLRALAKAAEVSDWQGEIAIKRERLVTLITKQISLVDIAATLEVPIDELERFCQSNLGPIFRQKAEILDKDLPIYKNTKKDLKKQDARCQAYVALANYDHFKGRLWAIRMILGTSKRHFDELREDVSIYGREQPGQGAALVGSQNKHEINRFLCSSFCTLTRKDVISIFEPTQGNGDGTKIYKDYGLVFAVERKEDPFSKAMAEHAAYSADLIEELDLGLTIENLLLRREREERFKVLMPQSPIDVYKIIPKMQEVHWSFDVIDVDPFQGIYEMFEAALPLLSDISMLFVSVNPSPRFGHTKEAAVFYRQEHNGNFCENLWKFDCRRYMWLAAKQNIALVPIVVQKRWTASNKQGIDRIYFLAVHHLNPEQVPWEYQDNVSLREDKISFITQYSEDTIPVIRFGIDVDDTSPNQLPNSNIIKQRLKTMLQRLSR